MLIVFSLRSFKQANSRHSQTQYRRSSNVQSFVQLALIQTHLSCTGTEQLQACSKSLEVSPKNAPNIGLKRKRVMPIEAYRRNEEL
jgi:hypothetical protein